MPPKKKSKDEIVVIGIIVGVLCLSFLFVLAHYFTITSMPQYKDASWFDTFPATKAHIQEHPFAIFPIPSQTWTGLLLILIVGMMLWVKEQKKKKQAPGEEEGSAKWNDAISSYNKKFTDPKDKQNMILTQEIKLSMDGRKTRRNNNILVVGGSGAGKSRFFVKPNVLQANSSYVVTDPSGELLESTGYFMEKKAGYRVRIFNLVQMEFSDHYNPFHYIHTDEDVLAMITTLIRNTTPSGASKGDPFWEKSETALLEAICFYLYYEVREEDQNFSNVMRMMLLAKVKENQEDYKSTLDIMFEQLEKRNPNHIAVKYYKIFKMGAGKTLKSILISATTRLGAFNLGRVQNLTNVDTIDLSTIGDEKTILYVVIPSADSTYNFLVSMMYSQLFSSLYFHAENDSEVCKHKRLPYEVRFLLDEFANIGEIPDFEKKLATMRKYAISCSIILQNLSQLKTMYKDAWESIIGNCDSFLFLGGQEQTTLETVSKKLGKRTIIENGYSRSRGGQGSRSESENLKGRDLMTPDEISRMDNNCCILFIRGLFPFFCHKYDYPRHPNYKWTGDNKDEYLYDYRDASRFKVAGAETAKITRDMIEAAREEYSPNIAKPVTMKKPSEAAQEVTSENVAKAMGLPEDTDPKTLADRMEVQETYSGSYEFEEQDKNNVEAVQAFLSSALAQIEKEKQEEAEKVQQEAESLEDEPDVDAVPDSPEETEIDPEFAPPPEEDEENEEDSGGEQAKSAEDSPSSDSPSDTAPAESLPFDPGDLGNDEFDNGMDDLDDADDDF